MSDTPPRSVPTPSPDMSVSDYRLMMVENKCESIAREMRRMADALQSWRSSDKMEMALAVERCASHGARINDLEAKLETHAKDESTAIVTVVQSEIERHEWRREKEANTDNAARTAGIIGTILGAAAAVKAWLLS